MSEGRRPTSLELGDLAGRLEAAAARSVDFVDLQEAPPGLAYQVFRAAWSCSNVTGRLSWPVVLFCFCAPRVHGGRKGLLFSVFPPQPFPTGLILSATLWQENARSYGPPVFFCPDETPNC